MTGAPERPAAGAPRGPLVGVDFGARRVGVAVADPETRIARPLEVVDATSTDAAARVAEIARELGAEAVVVGRPVGLSGRAGPAVEAQGRFVAELRAVAPCPVVEFDERLTTVVAERALRAAGGGRQARAALRDAVAAQVMLQGYVDAARVRSGGAP